MCGVSLFLLFGASLALNAWHRWTLGAFAILYNRVFPIDLREKGLWTIANIATAFLFWVCARQ